MLIEIDGRKIRLSTGLGEKEFAKTKFSLLMSEKGFIARSDDTYNEKEEARFTFSDWTFSSIESDESDGLVFFTGLLPESSASDKASFSPLYDLFEKTDSSQKIKLTRLILTALIQAEEKGFYAGKSTGAALVSIFEGKSVILFLPSELFYSCAAGNGRDYVTSSLMWENPLLEGNAARSFTKALLSYKALTNHFPFPNPDKNERINDILDKKYLPLEYAVKGINLNAAGILNRALTLKKDDEKLLPKNFSRQILKSFISAKNSGSENLSDDDFEKRKTEYLSNLNAKIMRKRKIRKNSGRLMAAGILFAFFIMILFSSVRNHGNQPSTMGLSPVQVTECFFESINQKDIQVMDAITRGKRFKPYISAVTNMHVANAASQAYTFTSVNLEPEKWFFYAADEASFNKTSLYGISNLVIDGYSSLLDAKTSKNKDKISPTCDSSDREGSTKSLNLSYYIVQTNGESGEIEVEYAKGSVTLTLQKKRWLLTDINVTADPLPFSTSEFKSEYFSALERNQKDVIKTCSELSFRYPWIPSTAVLEKQEKELKELF